MSRRIVLSLVTMVAGSWISSLALAQPPLPSDPKPADDKFLIDDGLSEPKPVDSNSVPLAEGDNSQSKESQLQQLLTGARFKGQFTTDGKPPTELEDDSYEIRKIQKLKPDGDKWALHARIKYGEHDLVVPIALRILWAGDTPVITMDNMLVPGLGTFSARVVLHGKRYAGTWQHDEVGGHLFGVIEPAEATENPQPPSQ